jgi:tetratricopeptide (TPR) repeat protein
MLRGKQLLAIAALVLVASAPAAAWGPRANTAVATTAAQVVADETNVPLTNLLSSIREGASVSRSELYAVIPEAQGDRVSAIESEMLLLQAVRGERIDPYYAYRLGVLGSLVARTATPFSGIDSPAKARYLADVDANIDRLPFSPEPRKIVRPESYFPRLIREANDQVNLIEADYAAGIGFQGAAAGSLPSDASRAVNAVADTWYTILRGARLVTGVSVESRREYVLGALDFYIDRGNRGEIASIYERLMTPAIATADLRKEIGDMFYEAGMYERAMEEYERVLLDEPARRDVIDRMATYYKQEGERFLEDDQLREALDAFQQAVRVDPIDEEARSLLLQAEQAVEERENRLAEARAALESAQQMQIRADRAAVEGDYARAIGLLQQAADLYDMVDQEFEEEYRRAMTSMQVINARLRDYRGGLRGAAASLSGSAVQADVRQLAASKSREAARVALQELLETRYRDAMEEVLEDRVEAPGE